MSGGNVYDMFGPKKGGPGNINIDLSEIPNVKCIHCGCEEFLNVTRLKMIPAMLSPSGKPGHAQMTEFRCRNSKCDWLFNPGEWEKHKNDTTKAADINNPSGGKIMV